jgi:hypothetical protein
VVVFRFWQLSSTIIPKMATRVTAVIHRRRGLMNNNNNDNNNDNNNRLEPWGMRNIIGM